MLSLHRVDSVTVSLFVFFISDLTNTQSGTIVSRVAELGSLSSGAKMAMKIFVKRVFTIFRVKCVGFARNRKFAKTTQ